MDLLNSFLSPEYESQIYKSYFDNKTYTKIEYINKSISFPINIISDTKIKKCGILIIINSGFIVECFNTKYENYIKVILDLIFIKKNSFNNLFEKYNLTYKNKINSEKTLIYLEFDYLGFNPILSHFIKNLIFFDILIVQNNINEILNVINISNDIDTDYLFFQKTLRKNLDNININNNINNNNKELTLNEFFQYYFLKNKEKYMTIISPYSNEKCQIILTKIFDKYNKDIRNNIIKLYDKYSPYKAKFKPFEEPSILLISKIDIDNNNILKLNFFFPFLDKNNKNILEYIIYMINGKRIGSLYYYLFKNRFIYDLYSYTVYNINMPPQIVIKIKLNSNFSQYYLKLILSKLINFLRKLKSDINLIKITYENYKKILLNNFNNNINNTNINNNMNYYSFLYEFTHNFIFLKNNNNNESNINIYSNILLNKFILPEFNHNLISNILDNIISLKNLIITLELHPKLYSILSNQIISLNDLIINNTKESNDFNTYIKATINTTQILNYSFTTQNWDNSSFKHKQDKKQYISKDINNISNNNINNKNLQIKLCLNNIANNIWYYFNEEKNKSLNTLMVFSKFRFLHPNIRNNTYNINQLNIKYYNYISKKIEQEFEEIFDIGNKINLTLDKNGINLELILYKNIYIKILEKIFSFFFEFEKDFFEFNDVDYITLNFKSDLNKAINCLQSALKNNLNEKFYEEKNKLMDIYKLKLYGINLEDNIYIDGLISCNNDLDFIKKIKNVLLKYNTREYDEFNIYTNISQFKQKILETKKIKDGNIYIYKLRQDFMEQNINYFLSFYQLDINDKQKKFFFILIFLLLKKHLNKKNNSCQIYKLYIDQIYYILIIRKRLDYPELIAKYITINIKKLIDIICGINDDKIIKKILLDLKSDFCNEIINEKNKFNFYWNEIYNSSYHFDFEIKDEKDFDEYINNKIDLNIFKNFFKDNFFCKQKKIEFLYYQENIKHYNNKNVKSNQSYQWNLDFINNNNFNISEFYNNIDKIVD